MNLLVVLALAVVAILYASVGHAGASGYIAVLSLSGHPPEVIRPVALSLNVAVAGITAATFATAGSVRWRLLWPFLLLGPPLALLGGALSVPAGWFHALIGVVLLSSAARLGWGALGRTSKEASAGPSGPPGVALRLLCGAVLGLLAGLTGTGGGIYLTPLLIFFGWATPREAAGISAVFILVNSLAGLAGVLYAGGEIPPMVFPAALVVAVGGAIGSTLGSRWLAGNTLRGLLAVVLLVAGLKLLLF
ncbi:MAG: sulfite exporter TauE/SafE family protein [Deltaproteobacteria bacterium]|nr:MAG: sulfite exporter TauE/SafE family protein [Deltaproteobacteria bacterium]